MQFHGTTTRNPELVLDLGFSDETIDCKRWSSENW